MLVENQSCIGLHSISTVNHEGERIMLWEWLSLAAKRKLVTVDGKMDRDKYRGILEVSQVDDAEDL